MSEDLFSRIDANHDGVVSREEFAKAFQARVAPGLGSSGLENPENPIPLN